MAEIKNFKKPAGRMPPNDLDAEMAVLGSIMLKQDALHEVIDTISPNSFYATKHKMIFEAMIELFSSSSPIDLVSVSARLKERGELESIGGNSYITSLINSVPTSANIKFYASIVYRKYLLRRLIEASDKIASLGYENSEDVDKVLDEAEKSIFEITNKSGTHTFSHIKDGLSEALDRLEKLHRSDNQLRGVPTGFTGLDNLLSGLQKSDLVILAARPSVGKTSLALDIARNAAMIHNIPVGIFSLEMSSQQLIDRMLAAESRVDAWKLRTGRLNVDKDFQGIRPALERLSQAPVYVDDFSGNTIVRMRSIARRLKSEKDLGLIVVDYLQLITPSNTRSDNVVQQVTEISRSLKNLARELDVPVLALSQLSRNVVQRGGKPRLADLRDSGAIEQDADVVMFIHREDMGKEDHEKTNIAEILIEKHRNGPTGKVDLYFNSTRSTFENIAHADFEELAKSVPSSDEQF